MRFNRRRFIKNTLVTGIGASLLNPATILGANEPRANAGKRIGMIGLDTGHSTAFVNSLNSDTSGRYDNYRVVAAYPKGTDNILEWKNRIPAFTQEVRSYGVEIVSSIADLIGMVDYIILTTIDGNKHLEQVLPVLEAGLPVFVDKPFTASLRDAQEIAAAAKQRGTPLFSSSSLRFMDDAYAIRNGSSGRVLGVDAYSPAHLEAHHPDLFWYGIHGVEILFTLMGTGCKSVQRTFTQNTEYVVGVWNDDRIGTFRGIREGADGYGGMVFTENGIQHLNKVDGYNALLEEIIRFFNTKIPPVAMEETLEIIAFMEAAERSKQQGGNPIALDTI